MRVCVRASNMPEFGHTCPLKSNDRIRWSSLPPCLPEKGQSASSASVKRRARPKKQCSSHRPSRLSVIQKEEHEPFWGRIPIFLIAKLKKASYLPSRWAEVTINHDPSSALRLPSAPWSWFSRCSNYTPNSPEEGRRTRGSASWERLPCLPALRLDLEHQRENRLLTAGYGQIVFWFFPLIFYPRKTVDHLLQSQLAERERGCARYRSPTHSLALVWRSGALLSAVPAVLCLLGRGPHFPPLTQV